MAKRAKKPPADPDDIQFAGEGLNLLRLVTDSLPALISYVDLKRIYRFNNKAYKTWFGISPEELYGKHVREILGDSYPAHLKKKISIALSGKKVSFEDQVAYRDGKTRYVRADYIPDIDKRGGVRGFFALVQDITERRLLEDELRTSGEHFRSLVENASDIIAVINFDGAIGYVSPPVKKILGYKPEELIDKKIYELFHTDDLAELSKAITEVALNPRLILTRNGRIRHKNGSFRIIEGHGKAALNQSGGITGIVINARDITEEKRVEDEKSALNKRLKV